MPCGDSKSGREGSNRAESEKQSGKQNEKQSGERITFISLVYTEPTQP